MKTITVLLEEEYGYRFWTWDTGLTEPELIKYWLTKTSVNDLFFSPEGKLPGKVYESLFYPREDYIRDIKKAWGDELTEAKFAEIMADPYVQKPTYYELCQSDEPHIWRAHIHCDDDSYLVDAEGKSYLHVAGMLESKKSKLKSQIQESESPKKADQYQKELAGVRDALQKIFPDLSPEDIG